MHEPDSATNTQLRLIAEMADTLTAASIEWWLFGGWAVDFHAGEITRDHADIELFAWECDIPVVREALTARGFVAPAGHYPDECQSFIKDGQEIGVWFLVVCDDGHPHTPGRWRNWPWMPGSFAGPLRVLLGVEAPVMSIEGLLDIKQHFAEHPHGAPLREKDHADIALLRRLIER